MNFDTYKVNRNSRQKGVHGGTLWYAKNLENREEHLLYVKAKADLDCMQCEYGTK
jgi:hypothetical protein